MKRVILVISALLLPATGVSCAGDFSEDVARVRSRKKRSIMFNQEALVGVKYT